MVYLSQCSAWLLKNNVEDENFYKRFISTL